MLDRQFTEMLQAWLNTPREERNVEQGATYLLQLTRNRHLFAFCTSGKPEAMPKLEYELNKHLLIRLQGQTMDDVLRLDNTLMPAVAALIGREQPATATPATEAAEATATAAPPPHPEAQHVGKRADHDTLPPEVQALYVDNFARYTRIKELYNHLLALTEAEPCDRYEYLQLLAEQDRAYREAWANYDSYQREADTDTAEADTDTADSEPPRGKAKPKAKGKAKAAPTDTAEAAPSA